MVKKIVVDSTVFIDYVRAGKGIYPHLVELLVRKKAALYLPTSVILELWVGASMHEERERKKIKRMLIGFKVTTLTRQLAEASGDLIRNGAVNGYVDSVIAATALELDAQLATSNVKHFKNVEGLRIFSTGKKN